MRVTAEMTEAGFARFASWVEREPFPRRLIIWGAGVVLGIAAILLLAAPLVRGVPLWDYTLDDAYITWRYAENLTNGNGPVWNVGEDPVEGYTSFLWTLMSAAVIGLQIDPVVGSKVLAGMAVLGIAVVLATYGHQRMTIARVVALGGLALSPAFLLVAIQGMETAVAALIAVGAACLLIESVQRPGYPQLVAFFGLGTLALVTRPDLAPFIGALVLGLFAYLLRDRDWVRMRRALGVFVMALILPSVAYIAWRWAFYGYPLPNTFYIKRSDTLVSTTALQTVLSFSVLVAGPYFALGIALYGRLLARSSRPSRGALCPVGQPERYAIGVLFAAVIAFIAAAILFEPIQGYLYRYQMPVYPVILLLLVLVSPAAYRPRNAPWPAIVTVAAAGLLLFPLHTLGETRFQVTARWAHDRAQAGKGLSALASTDATMLVTESGALPFYAGWTTTDLFGLNDEEIAHHGATAEYMHRLAPDLVMVGVPGTGEGLTDTSRRRELVQFLREDTYRFVTATVKTDSRLQPAGGIAHFYFIKPSSPYARRISAILDDVPDVIRPTEMQIQKTLEEFGLRPLRSRAATGE